MASSGMSDGQAWESGQGQELTKVTQEFKGLQGGAFRTASILPQGQKGPGAQVVAAAGGWRLLQDSQGAQSGGFPAKYRLLARARAARTTGPKPPGGEKNKFRV